MACCSDGSPSRIASNRALASRDGGDPHLDSVEREHSTAAPRGLDAIVDGLHDGVKDLQRLPLPGLRPLLRDALDGLRDSRFQPACLVENIH
jgi:hypothetical protein